MSYVYLVFRRPAWTATAAIAAAFLLVVSGMTPVSAERPVMGSAETDALVEAQIRLMMEQERSALSNTSGSRLAMLVSDPATRVALNPEGIRAKRERRPGDLEQDGL